MFFIWLAIGYLSGALPWSVWLGKWFYNVDPRQAGDGNPGTINAIRVGGVRLGIATLMLDFLKAFIPIAIARWELGFSTDQLFWIALMPSLGHAFSVFLRFRGGRALVTWFGVWSALTLYEIPLVMGATAIGASLLFKQGELRALAIPIVLILYLLVRGAAIWMVLLALAELLILAVKLSAFYLSPRRRELQAEP